MIEIHEERQKPEAALDPFKFLDWSVEFGKASEVFAEEIKYGEVVREPVDPGAVHHDIDGLRLVPDGGHWRLEARPKKLHAAKVPLFDPAADLAPLLELTEEEVALVEGRA